MYFPKVYFSKVYFPKVYFPKLYFPKVYFPKVYFLKVYFLKAYFPKVYFPKAYFPKVYFPKVYFPKVYFRKVYCKYESNLGPNFFDPNVTQAKLFQTERTRRLAHPPSFCELVFVTPCSAIKSQFVSLAKSNRPYTPKKNLCSLRQTRRLFVLTFQVQLLPGLSLLSK